jgi:hypothetical protein
MSREQISNFYSEFQTLSLEKIENFFENNFCMINLVIGPLSKNEKLTMIEKYSLSYTCALRVYKNLKLPLPVFAFTHEFSNLT